MTIHEPNIGRYYEDFNTGDIYKHCESQTEIFFYNYPNPYENTEYITRPEEQLHAW